MSKKSMRNRNAIYCYCFAIGVLQCSVLCGGILLSLRVIGFSHSSGYPIVNIDILAISSYEIAKKKENSIVKYHCNQRVDFKFESIIVIFMMKITILIEVFVKFIAFLCFFVKVECTYQLSILFVF